MSFSFINIRLGIDWINNGKRAVRSMPIQTRIKHAVFVFNYIRY